MQKHSDVWSSRSSISDVVGIQAMAAVTVSVAGTRPSGTATWAPSVAASCASIMTEVPSCRPAHTDNKPAVTLEEPVHGSARVCP